MVNNLEKNLNKLNVAIVTHIFSSGPALDLEVYLQKKTKNLIFIGHPFSFTKDKSSFCRIYSGGKLQKKHSALSLRLPPVFLYIKEFILTTIWILRYNKKINIFIGSDGYSAYIGLLLKKLGKVDEVILYTIDFVPNRFKNPILNFLYHFFDKKCLEECKIIWNVSSIMEKAREDIKNLNRKDYAPQITVPLGVWFNRMSKLKQSKKNNNSLVYMGHLLEKQGIDIMIKSLPYVKSAIPKIKFTIIGTGSHEDNLKRLVKKHKLEDIVHFTGYVKNHEDVEKMLAKSVLGLAMYKPTPDNYTYFADPGKLKNYLAAGLPVILTDVPPIAKELAAAKCAIISKFDSKELAKQIIKLLRDKKKLNMYNKNAVMFAKQYDWNDIFKKALSKSIN